MSLAFYPNLVEGDLVGQGPWNLSGKYFAPGGAVALITWDPVEDCTKERIAEKIYEHWLSCQDPDKGQDYWDGFGTGDDEDPKGGW